MECWVEPGGIIAARYIGENPPSIDVFEHWKAQTEFRNAHWTEWHDSYGDQMRWAGYMERKIRDVLNCAKNYGAVAIRRDRKSTALSDVVFMIHTDVYTLL